MHGALVAELLSSATKAYEGSYADESYINERFIAEVATCTYCTVLEFKPFRFDVNSIPTLSTVNLSHPSLVPYIKRATVVLLCDVS